MADRRIEQIIDRNDLQRESSRAGDTFERAVWVKGFPDDFKMNSLEAVSIDPAGTRGIYACHVGDPDYWIPRLAEDYERSPKLAKVIRIRLKSGDAVVEDVQYAMDPEGGMKADSAIILSSRSKLRRYRDFLYEGQGDRWEEEQREAAQAKDQMAAIVAKEAAMMPGFVARLARRQLSRNDQFLLASAMERAYGKPDYTIIARLPVGVDDSVFLDAHREMLLKQARSVPALRNAPELKGLI